MFDTTVERVGENLVLSVPAEMRDQLSLQDGDHLQIEVAHSEPRLRPRHKFAAGQLLREHAEVLGELDEDYAWDNLKPVGREIL